MTGDEPHTARCDRCGQLRPVLIERRSGARFCSYSCAEQAEDPAARRRWSKQRRTVDGRP